MADTVNRAGGVLDVVSFIHTIPVNDSETQQEVMRAGEQFATIIFTSMNAVEAVADILDGLSPEWTIYCIGHQTRELVVKYFGDGSIAATADNAAELADSIIDAEEESVIFFCGNKRRNELPEQLTAAGIDLQEIVVYETIDTPQTMADFYDAVLFYSPSAVNSFFSSNKLPEQTAAFAIGKSTAAEIKHKGHNNIIMSSYPEKEAMVLQAVDYCREKNNQ
jgi:uroporphyrinogen-III synthase